MEKTINITGHEIKEVVFESGPKTKHIVHDDTLKYEFFETKKDGFPTKASEQWMKRGLGVGKVVGAEVKEEPRSFFNQENGKDVKYTRRTILYFKGDEPEDSTVTEVVGGLSNVVDLSSAQPRVKAPAERVVELLEEALVYAKRL